MSDMPRTNRYRGSRLGLVLVALVAAVFLSREVLHSTGGPQASTASPDYTNAATVDGANSYLVKAGLATSTGGAVHITVPAVEKDLDALPATGSAWTKTYDRDAFGPAWADTDRNGCDQRNDVLRRDLSSVDLKAGTHGCVVLSGVLHDRYTGKTIDFERGETSSLAVQIDHMVPLSWAWQHGASEWSDAKREAFATDFANLTAVDGPTNEQKFDQGPATWLPPDENYACVYVARFTYVVASYHLSIDAADRTKIGAVLTACNTY
jgi:hypothetical protein